MDNHTYTTSARWSHEFSKELAGGGGVKVEEKKPSEKPQALKCPRCTSSHTKFCYYNNYNLSQPRYFCKTCTRYWTAGGSLRNVPVGGASRKKKLIRSSSSTYHHQIIIMPPPADHDDDDDDHGQPPSQNPSSHHHHHDIIQNHGSADVQHSCSSMGFFKTSNSTSAENDYATGMIYMNSFMPMPMVCVDGLDQNDNDDENNINQDDTTRADNDPSPSTGARLFFPLEDLKPSPTSHQLQLQGAPPHHSNSYWTGGGSW